MSSQMPELGAKISLISKADIRYEGRLFQVDPTECTIALASVRSYGTEDRETMYPVPAQSQIYEYILFRGSDIKDIRVVQTAIPQDPAIVQLVPHPQQQSGFSTSINHPSLNQSNHSLGGFANYGMGLGLQRAPGPLMVQQSELGPMLRSNDSRAGPSHLDKEPDLIGGVSRSTTPSVSRKSPTNDQGTQVNKSPPRDENKKPPRPIQPPDRDNAYSSARRDQQFFQSGQSGYNRSRDGNDNRRPFHENNRSDYGRNDGYNRRPNFRRDNLQDGQMPTQNRNFQQQQQQQPHQQSRPQINDGQPGNWLHRNQLSQQQRPPMNNNNRGNRGRGPGRQNNMMNRTGAPQGNKKTPLKFTDDYDFDKANTEFEELRSQLGKLKVNDAPVQGEPKAELEKKEDSGNETGTGETEALDEEVYYDKKKSFFDSISCEAVERSKGRSQRTDWRTERKLNTETFGVSSARRGMYRGRGYYGGGRNYGYRPRNNQGMVDNAAQGAPAEQLPEKQIPVEENKPASALVAVVAPPIVAAS